MQFAVILPVFETSDDFLNQNDFVSDGFVSFNLQKHVMMVLPEMRPCQVTGNSQHKYYPEMIWIRISYS